MQNIVETKNKHTSGMEVKPTLTIVRGLGASLFDEKITVLVTGLDSAFFCNSGTELVDVLRDVEKIDR